MTTKTQRKWCVFVTDDGTIKAMEHPYYSDASSTQSQMIPALPRPSGGMIWTVGFGTKEEAIAEFGHVRAQVAKELETWIKKLTERISGDTERLAQARAKLAKVRT